MSKSRPKNRPQIPPARSPKSTAKPDSSTPRPNSKAAALRAKARRRRLLHRVYAGFSVALLFALAVLAFSANSLAGYNTSATAWALPALSSGPKVSLHSLRGRPVVVNFFASWCKVCAAELPVFARDAALTQNKIDFVEVNSLETGNGSAFANRFALNSVATAVLTDVGGTGNNGLYQSLGGTGSLPMTAFYDSSGNLLGTHVGGYDATTLAAALHQYYPALTPSGL